MESIAGLSTTNLATWWAREGCKLALQVDPDRKELPHQVYRTSLKSLSKYDLALELSFALSAVQAASQIEQSQVIAASPKAEHHPRPVRPQCLTLSAHSSLSRRLGYQ